MSAVSPEEIRSGLALYEQRRKAMYDKYATHIGKIAIGLLKSCTDDYASKIWPVIEEDVFNDVLECSAVTGGEGFTNGDVALALGRVLYNRLGCENMTEPTLKRHCSVCGKPLTCDCYYSDYGLVKLDGQGHTRIEFDACPECLDKVVEAIKQTLRKE